MLDTKVREECCSHLQNGNSDMKTGQHIPPKQFLRNIFAPLPLLASKKIVKAPHILADVIGSKIKYLCLRNYFRKLPIRISSTSNNALHDFISNKMTVTRFVDTGGLLIRYSNGRTKLAYRQLKQFHDYF
jgi:hypothetical protein